MKFILGFKHCLLFLLFSTSLFGQQHEWTWLYKKHISEDESIRFKKRQQMMFVQYQTAAFTQLVFSWNAFRPKGHFSFLVQARDRQTKRWHPWHHMIDWGETMQQSYNSTTRYETNYHHVRLELPKGKRADAFRIKVKSKNGADLALLKSMYVSLSDFSRFEHEHGPFPRTSITVPAVPRQSQMVLLHQECDRLCSPTTMSMFMGCVMKTYIDPIAFAQKAYDIGLDSYGSWPFNTAHAYEQCNGMAQVYVARLPSFVTLYNQLQRGMPVAVSVRGTLKGAAKDYPNGHLLLVIGWNAQKKQVVCHDPAFGTNDDTVISYDIKHFLQSWECSRRLAYIAEPTPKL